MSFIVTGIGLICLYINFRGVKRWGELKEEVRQMNEQHRKS